MSLSMQIPLVYLYYLITSFCKHSRSYKDKTSTKEKSRNHHSANYMDRSNFQIAYFPPLKYENAIKIYDSSLLKNKHGI